MISRKKFLGLSALGTVGLTQIACVAKDPGEQSDQKQSDLPPSIAALSSMKDRVRPITNDERKKRIEKAKRLMSDNKMDAIVIMGGSTLEYFSGIQWGISERMLALVIPQKRILLSFVLILKSPEPWSKLRKVPWPISKQF